MKTMKIVIMIVLTLTTIIMSGLTIVIQNKTIIDWRIPTSLCALAAIPAGLLMSPAMRRITLLTRPLFSIFAGFLLAFAIFAGTFYSINYFKSDKNSVRECKVSVINKYVEERYHVQRMSRNRVRKGEKYPVYFISVQWPDGRIRKIEIAVSEYVKIKPGAPLTLSIENGFFGIPVIKSLSFPIRQYKPIRKHDHKSTRTESPI